MSCAIKVKVQNLLNRSYYKLLLYGTVLRTGKLHICFITVHPLDKLWHLMTWHLLEEEHSHLKIPFMKHPFTFDHISCGNMLYLSAVMNTCSIISKEVDWKVHIYSICSKFWDLSYLITNKLFLTTNKFLLLHTKLH